MEGPVGYYRHPTVHGDEIAFVAEDDLWLVPVTGGAATRLTANPGAASFPCFSPDGTMLAYVSQDEGHPEAHVIDVRGGPARRLTHFGGLTSVVGWRSGTDVVVTTDFEQPFAKLMELVSVPVNRGLPQRLDYGPARDVTFEPGGRGVVVGRNTADPARWKRYRGGTAGDLWIRRGSDGFRRLIELDGNLARPMWIGRRIYFLSDHEGFGNLYSCTPTGRSLQRHTDHADFYARYPHTDGRSIVYHAGADIWRYDLASGTTAKVDVRLPSARPQRNRRFESAQRHVESVDLSADGARLAITARGAVLTSPMWEGAPRTHGLGSSTRLRLATWLPDGERFVALSDASGEERITVFSADGSAEPRQLSADVGRPHRLEASPAGADRVAVVNERQEVLLVNLRSGQARQIHKSDHARVSGLAWSPDGRWLAFGASATPRTTALFVADTSTGRVRRVTSGDFQDGWPSFDPAGAYLYFLSWRTYNPVSDALFFDHGFPSAAKPYVIPLSTGVASPFSAEHRPARAPGGPSNGNGDDKAKNASKAPNGSEPSPVTIDFEGIERRLVPVPVPEGRYTAVRGVHGRILFSSVPVEGALSPGNSGSRPKGRLQAYDFNRDRVESVMEGVSGFSTSMDGKTIAVRAGRKVRVVPAGFKEEGSGPDDKNRETGWVDMSRFRMEVDPGAEWAQMLREAWRLQRDQFWTEDMSGVDWVRVYQRYSPLLERVAARSEFSDLMWEMQGELGTSHAYELGGDYRPQPRWYRGFLGADIGYDRRAGAWRVERVVHGDPWNPAATSPLGAPGVDVRAGDRLLSVDGVTLDAAISPGAALADRAGRAVVVEVARGRRRPRSIAVKTLRSERELRYRDWVETNRAAVHEATDGRAGYVHIPNMSAVGFAEFHRYYPVEVLRDGLIIDVRYNGGGNVSQILLERLLRTRVGYNASRHGGPFPYPADSPAGPMVALTNEWAGSDGDIFSHAFKLYGLGPLIGTRTWGGVIGIWPRHTLVDGTVTTQPEFSYWFTDVGWQVENHGTDPDIVVEVTPDDHRASRDPQLDRGVAEVLASIDAAGDVSPEFGPKPSKKPPRLP